MNYQHEEEAEGVEIVANAWSSELPADLLGMITDNLPLSQFIRFGSVCLGWRSFSIENYQHIKLPNQLPVLLIPIPPSSLLLTHHYHHHHQEKRSFPDDDDEEEELEPDEKEEKVTTDKEEEKEIGEENDIEKEIGEEENDIEKAIGEEENDIGEEEKDTEKEEVKEKEIGEEKEKEEEEDEEEEEEEEEEEDVERRPVVLKNEHYYDPKEIWQGQDAKQRYKSTRTFYSLSEKRVYHDFRLPVPYYKNLVGSSYGWLVAVEECYADNGQLHLSVSLINPFRTDNNEIQLPPITNGNPGNLDIGERIKQSYFLIKVVLSANPSSLSDPTTQLVVFAIYGFFRLAFCRPCDKAWTRLDLEDDDYRPVQDVICYDGQVYAILQNGWVFAFVFDPSQFPLLMPIVTLEISPPDEVNPNSMGCLLRYLVESGGDLLQIRRNVDCTTPAKSGRPYPHTETDGYITSRFLVFKLDPTGEEWLEMKTLDDHMLFIGMSSSISLSASDFPGWSRPNSIYYTDDHVDGFITEPLSGPHDMGIFNLEDGSFERHYEAESMTVMPPPIWIQPML